MRNDCWRSEGFYACDQIVNGESKALIVFTYSSKDDIFHNFAIPSEGGPANSGKLSVQGNVWIYPWEDAAMERRFIFRW